MTVRAISASTSMATVLKTISLCPVSLPPGPNIPLHIFQSLGPVWFIPLKERLIDRFHFYVHHVELGIIPMHLEPGMLAHVPYQQEGLSSSRQKSAFRIFMARDYPKALNALKLAPSTLK